MKKILWLLIFLPVYGCVVSTQGPSANNDVCSSKPAAALDEESAIETISLENGAVSQSGQLNIGQQKGYMFAGEPGQELSYRTDDAICIWVYAPDSTLMSSNDIEKKGKYILQVASLQGSTSYELDIGFGDLPSPDADTPVSNNSEASNPESLNTTLSTQPDNNFDGNNSTLSQANAKSLIEEWLNAKSEIFAPPFDRELVGQLTTGLLHDDITKRNGSIDWLKNNNSYHVYNSSSVKKVWSFDNDSKRPSIKVSIYEDRILYENGKGKSSASTNVFTYFFTKENGKWKIDDYKDS